MTAGLTHRRASRADLEAIGALMARAISELQKPSWTTGRSNRAGPSWGSTPSSWTTRSARLLDPAHDAARVRAMYTHPGHTRKGVGRLILSLCEHAARAEGFRRVELMATLAGEPLYVACGYAPLERIVDERGGAGVPLVRMHKSL